MGNTPGGGLASLRVAVAAEGEFAFQFGTTTRRDVQFADGLTDVHGRKEQ